MSLNLSQYFSILKMLTNAHFDIYNKTLEKAKSTHNHVCTINSNILQSQINCNFSPWSRINYLETKIIVTQVKYLFFFLINFA